MNNYLPAGAVADDFPQPLPPQQKRCNHALHAILSLFTCGTWLFAWPFVALYVMVYNRGQQTRYTEQLNQWQWQRAQMRSQDRNS